jgi:UDP-N-acetylglucosamine 2-epimerase (non-hydrolysing)
MSGPDTRRAVLLVYGTRPEAIKVSPVVKELARHGALRPVVAVTGQHREMLDQLNRVFGIEPDFDLNIISPGQTLFGITVKALTGLEQIVRDVDPAALVVQGDTTTAFAAALAGFYQQVPVVHLEAGLRTSNRYNPFPEEMNRRLASQLADVHLAPTSEAKANLLAEDVPAERITITGNTVIDALYEVTSQVRAVHDPQFGRFLEEAGDRKVLLVTSHRRESWGDPMRSTAAAVAELARLFPELRVLLPAHRNPIVRDAIVPFLEGLSNVTVTEPLEYPDFCRALQRSTVVLTDSGGVQEEAPSLGKPVLVLRDTTERPEAVRAGVAKLVGTDQARIVAEVSQLLTDRIAYDAMAQHRNPYGDGLAARRSVEAIAAFLGLGPRPEEFRAHQDASQILNGAAQAEDASRAFGSAVPAPAEG